MAKWIGGLCIILGIACLICAMGFIAYNRKEAENAEKSTSSMLKEVQSAIEEQKEQGERPAIMVDGYECIGILSIPALDLELPILKDWSYTKLKKAPCLYYGSYLEKNFVIAAHNYKAHFGRLSQLQAGDDILFTAANGATRHYKVTLLETLPKTATEEMITAGFDLSLYTCTKGGENRVTVRCNLAE